MTHLVLAVPGWKLSPLHVASREQLMVRCMQQGIELSMISELASGIDLARNITVAKFLQWEEAKPDDVLGMIDSDIAFAPDSVLAVLDALKHGLEVVGALYPKKIVDYANVVRASKRGVPDAELRYHAGAFVGGAEAGSRRSWTSQDGKHRFVDADKLGTGFLFMRRDAIEKFVVFHRERIEHHSHWEPVGKSHLVFFSEPMGPRQKARDLLLAMIRRYGRNRASMAELGDSMRAYNEVMDGHELDAYQTEDFSFTLRAKEAGIHCWMHLDAVLAHQGTWVFEGQVQRSLKEASE